MFLGIVLYLIRHWYDFLLFSFLLPVEIAHLYSLFGNASTSILRYPKVKHAPILNVITATSNNLSQLNRFGLSSSFSKTSHSLLYIHNNNTNKKKKDSKEARCDVVLTSFGGVMPLLSPLTENI